MSNVTKPIILDETGLRIAQAIESLAQGGSGSKYYVTPEMYGAKGDGETDDYQAIQDAVDSGCGVIRFADNKTYFVGDKVVIDHDCSLIGGNGTTIKAEKPSGGSYYDVFIANGTKKKTTSLTGDYTSVSGGDNSANQFTLSDMTNVNIGDILVIKATDQYYAKTRQYYYLGATLLVSDVYNGHIYTSDIMPWDIENTENVTVEVYEAPEVHFENLKFVSEYDGIGSYTYFIGFLWCKNSSVKNINMDDMPNGVEIHQSVNTLIDCVTLSRSKYVNSISNDSYGIYVSSATNTIIRRVMAIDAQGCVDLGGTIPNINTYIYNSNLFSQCRATGIDLHENSYNLIVEDCVVAGLALSGTAKINRCRFVPNKRVPSNSGVMMKGSHNPAWARYEITNCSFAPMTTINIGSPAPQNPIESIDAMVGRILIRDCDGGIVNYDATTSANVLSNTINEFIIERLMNCEGLIHVEGAIIKHLEVIDSEFTNIYWIRKGNNQAFYYDGIEYMSVHSDYPVKKIITADIRKKGMKCYLPKDVNIPFASSDATGHYVVCGNNIASNDPLDYSVGFVSGSVGSAPTRSVNNTFSSAVGVDQSGNLVITQPNSTANADFYPKCFAYTPEDSTIKVSLKIKNTGETDGAAFRAYIATVDADTGLLTYKNGGTAQTATAEGVTITHQTSVKRNSLVLCYVYCNTPVKNAVTTFENFVAKIIPIDVSEDPVVYEEYNGSSRTGDGTLQSVEGVNYIMATPASFTAKFRANLLD